MRSQLLQAAHVALDKLIRGRAMPSLAVQAIIRVLDDHEERLKRLEGKS